MTAAAGVRVFEVVLWCMEHTMWGEGGGCRQAIRDGRRSTGEAVIGFLRRLLQVLATTCCRLSKLLELRRSRCLLATVSSTSHNGTARVCRYVASP